MLRYTVDDEMRDLEPGQRMYTPRGSVHAFSNPHDSPARALVILTPDIGAQYFRDVAEVASAPSGPNPAKMAEVMTRYGLILAPPKPAAPSELLDLKSCAKKCPTANPHDWTSAAGTKTMSRAPGGGSKPFAN